MGVRPLPVGDRPAHKLARGGGEPTAQSSLPGWAVQLDPIKPTLKAPGAQRLTLTCVEVLSSIAFKINYVKVGRCRLTL